MNQRSWTVGRFSSVALQRGRRSVSLCVKTNLAGSVLAGSSLQHCTSLGSAVSSQRRGYYEDIKRKRDGSDTDGPEAFFEDFPKSPHVQQVPQDLHKTNKAAVGAAESMSMGFAAVIAFLFAVLLVAGKLEWDEGLPHSGRRPAGYGVSPPRDSSAPYRDSIFKKE